MASMIDELTKAGWIRVGPYSPYWKAPDDTGPVGRKWSEHDAHREMSKRAAARKAERAARKAAKAAAAESEG